MPTSPQPTSAIGSPASDVRADGHERRRGVAVVDVAPLVGAAVEPSGPGRRGRIRRCPPGRSCRSRWRPPSPARPHAAPTVAMSIPWSSVQSLGRVDSRERLEREHPPRRRVAVEVPADARPFGGALDRDQQRRGGPDADGAAGRSQPLGELEAPHGRLGQRPEVAGVRQLVADIVQPRLERLDIGACRPRRSVRVNTDDDGVGGLTIPWGVLGATSPAPPDAAPAPAAGASSTSATTTDSPRTYPIQGSRSGRARLLRPRRAALQTL